MYCVYGQDIYNININVYDDDDDDEDEQYYHGYVTTCNWIPLG